MSVLPDPSQRTTTDLVVLGLAVTVCIVIVLATLGIVVVEAINPDADTADEAKHVADLLSVIIGAIVGFVGGRGSREHEAQQRQQVDPPRSPDVP